MKSVTALEAKTRFGELLERVMNGEEVVITRHQKAVARLIPEGQSTSAAVENAVDGLIALQKRTQKFAGDRTPKDWKTLKEWLNEGRK
jgi:prevent-host-death family protein